MISDVYDYILSQTTEKYAAIVEKQVAVFIDRNKDLTANPHFTFQGTNYCKAGIRSTLVHPLHPSLVDEFTQDCLPVLKQWKMQFVYIRCYLSHCFTLAGENIANLYVLLDTQLHGYLPPVDDSVATLKHEAIAHTLVTHEYGLQSLLDIIVITTLEG